MQTILGAGGAVGIELAKALPSYTQAIRLVARNPKKVNPTDELYAADLLDAAAVDGAVAGSDVVYLVAGLVYKTKVWQAQWPRVMRNVLDACIRHNARLVFFDNVYMYDPAHMQQLTEETPVRPVSKKGVVRAQIAQMLLDEVAAGRLQAMIVRAADFISTKNSVLIETVANNLRKGRKANWLMAGDKVHSFTYVPDAGRATALLGNTTDAYNQVWHLPTPIDKQTGRQWVALFANELNVAPRISILSRGMLSVLGLFIPVLKEVKEMAYQYDRDYFFDSSKFRSRFGEMATPPAQAVHEVLQQL